jgi:8-oxo-dGTP pyrophosphatase MutT (NUDIX family)
MTDDPSPKSFVSYCNRVIREQLPGVTAQREMAPVPDRRPGMDDLGGLKTRDSAVLILFSLQEPHAILYTVRNEELPHHGGQISFPGGRQEPGETPIQTAQRETAEEVGIGPEQYKIVGCMSPLYVPPSRFIIHPWLAFCEDRPAISVPNDEVSEAFWVPLDDLLDPKKVKTRNLEYGGERLSYPFWDVHRVPIWGATAMITSEILALYRDFIDKHPG